MASNHSKYIFLVARIGRVYSHPLSAETGQKAVYAAKLMIKRSIRADLSCQYEKTDGFPPAIACLQIFIDKSALSLIAESFPFLSLHTTLLSFSKEWDKRYISSRRSLCAFLPVSYEHGKTEIDHGDERLEKGSKSMKPDKKKLLAALSESIELSLKPIGDTVFRRLHYTSLDCAQFYFIFLLTYYIADIP